MRSSGYYSRLYSVGPFCLLVLVAASLYAPEVIPLRHWIGQLTQQLATLLGTYDAVQM